MRLVFFLVSQSKKSYHAHHPHKCFQEQTPPSLVGRIIAPDSPAHTHRLPFLPLSLVSAVLLLLLIYWLYESLPLSIVFPFPSFLQLYTSSIAYFPYFI